METQPVERVTVETQPAVRTKNPKKVAAGKAAYAARKEREAKMLEDLRNHKKSLKEPERASSEPEPTSSEPDRSKPGPSKQTPSKQDHVAWTAAGVLGFGIGAAICYFYFQKEQKPETKSCILKTSVQSNIDPFDL